MLYTFIIKQHKIEQYETQYWRRHNGSRSLVLLAVLNLNYNSNVQTEKLQVEPWLRIRKVLGIIPAGGWMVRSSHNRHGQITYLFKIYKKKMCLQKKTDIKKEKKEHLRHMNDDASSIPPTPCDFLPGCFSFLRKLVLLAFIIFRLKGKSGISTLGLCIFCYQRKYFNS